MNHIRKLTVVLLAAMGASAGCGGGGGGGSDSSDSTVGTWLATAKPSFGVDRVHAIAKDDSFLYVVGTRFSSGQPEWRIEKRSLSTGKLVPGFGTAGVVLGGFTGTPRAIVLDSTHLYIAGDRDFSPSPSRWFLQKLTLDKGTEIPAFTEKAFVTAGVGQANAVAIDRTNGFLYVVGADRGTPGGDAQWRIEKRYLSDGTPETAFFGTGGVIKFNPTSGGDEATAVALDIDSDHLYVAGVDENTGFNDRQWRVEKRLMTFGTSVAGFGTGGVITSDPSAGHDVLHTMAINKTHMVLAGMDMKMGGADAQWRIEKRALSNGNVVAGFTDGSTVPGVVNVNPSALPDEALSVVLDAAYVYVAGFDSSPGTFNGQWRIERRNISTGKSEGGVRLFNVSSGFDACAAILLGPSDIYAAGYDDSQGAFADYQWRIMKITK